MLGLNKQTTTYTITAYYYEYLGTDNYNKQNWNPVPRKFKCNYATTSSINRINNTYGMSISTMTLQTVSSINFKENDKIVFDGVTRLVKQQIIDHNPLTGKYTNKPTIYTKFLEIQ